MMALPSLGFHKLNENVSDPTFATEGSACFDIFSYFGNEHISLWLDDPNAKQARQTKADREGKPYVLIYPQERMLIPTGLIFDIPKNHSVRIHVRSSVALKQGLLLGNGEGVIDSDYVDPCFIILYNSSNTARQIFSHTRYAQGELIKNYKHNLKQIENAPEQKTERDGGFGSTGEQEVSATGLEYKPRKGPSTSTAGIY
tara:strand:+ start:3331 stop:3930 length:600 start_codon:yes stop_codon:yes gene_type:complete